MKNFFLQLVFTTIFLFFILSETNAQWMLVGGPYGKVNSIVTKGDIVFAGGLGGVYRSSDDGSSWITVNSGLQDEVISSLAIVGSEIFAGTSDYHHSNLYISTDNGISWKATNFKDPFYNYGITAIAVKDSNILAGTVKGILISTNKGDSWIYSDSGMTNTIVHNIFVYNNNIFVGTLGGGIFKSADNGVSWVSSDSGITDQNIYSFASIGNNLYAASHSGIFHSTDNGISWDIIKVPDYYPAEIIAAKDSVLYVASSGSVHGVIVSTDKGVSWAVADNGMSKYPLIYSLAVNKDYIFAGGKDGIYRSGIGAINWIRTSVGSFIHTFTGKELDNSSFDIFVGTSEEGLFTSKDNGNSWRNIGLQDRAISRILLNGNDLFVSTGHPRVGGIFLSTNNGIDWTEVDKGLRNDFYSYYVDDLAIDSTNLLAGTEAGLFLSTNYGMDWTITNLTQFIKLILVRDSYIIVASSDSVFRSIDHGENWVAANNGLAKSLRVQSLVVIPNSIARGSLKIFAGTSKGIFKSTNGGISWEQAGLDSDYIFCMAAAGKNLFAGTEYQKGKIFLSTDEGVNWKQIDTGLNSYVSSLAVVGNYIFAGAGYDGGIWRRPLSEVITGIEDQKKNIPVDFSLLQNYPNPFNPVTTISYEIPKSSFVTLKIYDLLGREAATLVNEEKPAGSYNIQFSGRNLSSGIYFYRLTAGDYTSVKKMILLR